MNAKPFAQPRPECSSALGDRSGGQVEGRSSDVRSPATQQKKANCWSFLKPSDGLEPSTPSYYALQAATSRNRWR